MPLNYHALYIKKIAVCFAEENSDEYRIAFRCFASLSMTDNKTQGRPLVARTGRTGNARPYGSSDYMVILKS
jgi:hypothetical protein